MIKTANFNPVLLKYLENILSADNFLLLKDVYRENNPEPKQVNREWPKEKQEALHELNYLIFPNRRPTGTVGIDYLIFGTKDETEFGSTLNKLKSMIGYEEDDSLQQITLRNLPGLTEFLHKYSAKYSYAHDTLNIQGFIDRQEYIDLYKLYSGFEKEQDRIMQQYQKQGPAPDLKHFAKQANAFLNSELEVRRWHTLFIKCKPGFSDKKDFIKYLCRLFYLAWEKRYLENEYRGYKNNRFSRKNQFSNEQMNFLLKEINENIFPNLDAECLKYKLTLIDENGELVDKGKLSNLETPYKNNHHGSASAGER